MRSARRFCSADAMSTPITAIHILRLISQVETNLTGLQRDMRINASAWRQTATDQSVDAVQLALNMGDAVAAYRMRLGWVTTLQADTALWPKVCAMLNVVGGTSDELDALMVSVGAAVDALAQADRTAYAGIVSACDAVLASVDAPPSLWPE